MCTIKEYTNIYEKEYGWLPRYFEELGFTRDIAYRVEKVKIADDFINKEENLIISLSTELLPQDRSLDVVGIRLNQITNPSVEKCWCFRQSDLDEETLKEELKLAVDAFSKVEASYADCDDNEPLYWDGSSKPLLRGEEYYISEGEKWIHARTLGELYIKALQLGCRLYDIRPIKVDTGNGDRKENGGDIDWETGYGGFVNDNYSETFREKLLAKDPLYFARKVLMERVKKGQSEIFSKEDVKSCLGHKIEPIPNRLSCPICGKPSEELCWIQFSSPPQTWRELCGRAGPMSICEECGWQVEFFCEMMN